MPYVSDKINIAGTKYDRRAKLNQDERNAIAILVEKGYSQRKLAAMFGVSRRLVQHIIHPQPRSKPVKRSPEYWAEAKRKSRRHKHELYKAGIIRVPKNKNKCRTTGTCRRNKNKSVCRLNSDNAGIEA